MPEPERLAAVRAALPALAAGIYLNTGSVGPLPVEVAAAMADASARELAQGRAHMDDWLEFQERLAEARAAVAALLTTDPSAIALTHSTTDSINAIVLALGLGMGDHVVTTDAEHAGVLGPVYAARAIGVGADIVDIGDGGDDERTLAAIEAAITPKTRLVLASHVLWTTGAVLPIARIAELAHEHEAVLVVDGAQSAGAIRVDLEATGADAYAVAAQKWLLGPEGMGALAVRPWLVERLTPALAGHFSFERLAADGTAVFHPSARRFEWSGMHRPSVVGMARAISWLSMFVGLEWIHARGQATARGRRRPPRLDPRRHGADADPPDGDAGHVPDRRLAGGGGAGRAREPRLRHRPHDRQPRRAADQRRLLHLGRGARPLRRDGRTAGGTHAGDHPAAPDPDDPRQRLR